MYRTTTTSFLDMIICIRRIHSYYLSRFTLILNDLTNTNNNNLRRNKVNHNMHFINDLNVLRKPLLYTI